MNYGFLMTDNKGDYLAVRIPLDPTDPNYEFKVTQAN